MPNYSPIKTEYINNKCNVLIRLNKKDTVRLIERLLEIQDSEGGVNLILMSMRPALSLTYSEERDEQIKFIAFSNKNSFTPDSVQLGYKGEWSHIEIAVPKNVNTLTRIKDWFAKVGDTDGQPKAD